jgi:hypothetical protein
MSGKTGAWTFREAYVLALAPAVGLFCVNRYEAGRFAYLGIPTEFIDLPITRLIAGGTAIVVLGAMLFVMVRSAVLRIRSKSGLARFVGGFLLAFALLGIPQLLMASTIPGFVWSFLLPLCMVAAVTGDSKKPKKDEADVSLLDGPGIMFFLGLVGLLAWMIFSFGFFLERGSADRLCLRGEPDAFVAAFYGERAIVKHVDGQSRRLKPGIELRDIGERIRLETCSMKVIGMPGFFDRAFAENIERAKQRGH